MIRVVTDSSALYNIEQGKALGFDVLPLTVQINNQTYVDLCTIQSPEFVEIIKQGHVPTSSQPPVGNVLEVFEKYPGDQILYLCMSDGLSGTYASAVGARETVDNKEDIYVVNTETLCGPHRYMLDLVREAVANGATMEECLDIIHSRIPSHRSFLLPIDFKFLERGGRLTPLAATIGGLLKIQPVLMTTPDGKRLEKFNISRTFMGGIKSVLKVFKELEDPTSYKFYIAHGLVPDVAQQIKELFLAYEPNLDINIVELSPVFITQGGPGCVALQWIKK